MRLHPARPTKHFSPPRPPLRVKPCVPRGAAFIDVREPPVAVWFGEVVIVAAPQRDELRTLLAAAVERTGAPPQARAGHHALFRVAEPERDYRVSRVITSSLSEDAWRGAAVLAGIVLQPSAPGRRRLAAVRQAIERRVPCRCLWLVAGRIYPE